MNKEPIMFSCPHTHRHVRELRNMPLFPLIPLVPMLMAASCLGLLLANYRNGRKILEIVEGLESDLAQQGEAPEAGAPGEAPEGGPV
jgi:hypothetical protein